MQRARAFFLVCAGIFLLAIAYHLGATSATAQAPGNPVVAMAAAANGPWVAVTASGDTYSMSPATTNYAWTLQSNVFSGGSTGAQHESFGSVKARYR